MLVIDKNGESGASLPPLAYVGRRGGIGRFILPVTRRQTDPYHPETIRGVDPQTLCPGDRGGARNLF